MYVTRALTYTPLIAVPVFVVAVVFAKPLLVTLYTPKFAAATGALMLIGVGRILYTFWSPLLYALNGCDFPHVVFRTQAARLCVSAPVILGLTYVFGLMGTIIGFIVAHAVPLLGGVYYGKRIFSDIKIPVGVSHQVVSGAVMAVVLLILDHFIPPTTTVKLGMAIVSGTLAYFGVLMVRSPDIRNGLLTTLNNYGPM